MSVPGLVATTKNRATGVQVELWDTRFLDALGADSRLRWSVRCLAHDTAAGFATQQNAYEAMSSLVFCTPCNELKEAGKKYDPREAPKAQPEDGRTVREEVRKPLERMTVTERMQANLCSCGEALRGEGGHFHTTSFPVSYVCCKCAGHGARKDSKNDNQEGHDKPGDSARGRHGQVRSRKGVRS